MGNAEMRERREKEKMKEMFFIEWQLLGYGSVITKKETREEAQDFIKDNVLAIGAEFLGVWGGRRWHLWDDGKIYNFGA